MSKKKRVENLIHRVSNAYTQLCDIDPSLEEGFALNTAHRFEPTENRIVFSVSPFWQITDRQGVDEIEPEYLATIDMVCNIGRQEAGNYATLRSGIDEAATKGEDFDQLVNYLERLQLTHDIDNLDVKTVVNVEALINRADRLSSIAQSMVDEGNTDAEYLLEELHDIKKSGVGSLARPFIAAGLGIPSDYEGHLSLSARARLMFNGKTPRVKMAQSVVEDYVKQIAHAYYSFKHPVRKATKYLFNTPLTFNKEKEEAFKLAEKTLNQIVKTGAACQIGEIVTEVTDFVHELSKVKYFRKPNLQDFSRNVEKVIQRCDSSDPRKLISHIRQYQDIIQKRKKLYSKLRIGYLTSHV